MITESIQRADRQEKMVPVLPGPLHTVCKALSCVRRWGGGGDSFLSHSAVSQGIIITHDDSLIKRADSRLHILMHFLPRCNGQMKKTAQLCF